MPRALLIPRYALFFPLFLADCGGNKKSVGVAPTITAQPASATVAAGQTATFSISSIGTAPLDYQWQRNGSPISGATSSSYTTPATVAADSGARFTGAVSNAFGTALSNDATLTVTAPAPDTTKDNDVVTYHNDAMRTGLNPRERILTPTNVTSATFGKVGELAVDSQIDGQALYLGQLAIPGKGTKNVLYFATEKDTVYAVDADSISGPSATILWKTPALATGETAVPLTSLPCGNIDPNGITATPVIDRSRNAIYVVAFSTDGNGHFFHRLHALDLATGKEPFGGPIAIEATYPGTGANSSGGTVAFLPLIQGERAALLESGNRIYLSWAGRFGDCGDYSGWVMAYDAGTLAKTSVIDLVPNGRGAGIWLGGGGPAADASGDVYLATSNAFGASAPGTNENYGDAFVRLSGATLSVADYFAPSNVTFLDNSDLDLGSSGPLLLPDLLDGSNLARRLAVVAGKDGVIYVLNRDSLGRYDAATNHVYQQLPSDGQPNFSSPVYFNNTVFIGPANLSLRAFSISRALLATAPSSQSAHLFGATGTVPSISSNGTTNGIVWALDAGRGALFAYDATDLTKVLYDSTQAAAGRDRFSAVAGNFITPLVTNGRVYFGTGSTVAVFGLLAR